MDGKLDAKYGGAPPPSASASEPVDTDTDTGIDFTIGQKHGGVQRFRGYIDELVLYNRALNPEEIAQIYEIGSPK